MLGNQVGREGFFLVLISFLLTKACLFAQSEQLRYTYPLEFLPDSSFSIQELAEKKFYSLKDCPKSDVFWVKFELENTSPFPVDFYLEIENISLIEVYELSFGFLEKVCEAGLDIPYNAFMPPIINWRSSGFFVSFPASARRFFFVRVQDKYNGPDKFLPKYINFNQYNLKTKQIGLASGLFFGFFLLNAMLFGALGILAKKKLYLFYGAASLFSVLSYLSVYGYTRFIAGSLKYDYLWWILTSQSMALFYVLFVREAVETKTKFKKYDWILMGLVYLRIFMAVFGYIMILGFDARELIKLLIAVEDLVNLIAGTYLLIKIYGKGNTFVNYLLIGTIVVMVALFFAILGAFDFIAVPEQITYLQIGFVFQFCVLSLGMGWQTKADVERDLENKRQILELTTQANEKLEIEVQNRTRELQESNRIVKQKNEELKASEEELRQNMEELQVIQESLQLQKNQLQEKNLTIEQSIRAALTIQKTILPEDSKLKDILGEYSLIYLPRDIVSGDFYWVWQKDNLRFVVLADCTGHGVPGAFISMVGNNLLENIIIQNHFYSPAQIVAELHRGLRRRLNQVKSRNNEGMDVAVCVIESTSASEKIRFAAAKNRLYHLLNGTVDEYRGDRKSIGGIFYNDNLNFSEIEIEGKKGEILYLLSDGLPDQANNLRKSFGFQRFKTLLNSIHALPLEEQKEQILISLNEYQTNVEQRDDITVLGWRL